MRKFVVVRAVRGGTNVFGPFSSVSDANGWAQDKFPNDYRWSIVRLAHPAATLVTGRAS